MQDQTDYECYLLGCESAEVEPLEEWRFRVVQKEYLRRPDISAWSSPSPISEFVLEQLARLVAEGCKIKAGGNGNSEEPGAAASGVREPRVPREPVLAGSAARSLPSPDTPDSSFWRT